MELDPEETKQTHNSLLQTFWFVEFIPGYHDWTEDLLQADSEAHGE